MTAKMLSAYCDSVRGRPFSWADWNCAHFVATWVALRTGHDYLDGQTFADKMSTRMFIKDNGGSFEQAISRFLQRGCVPATFAQTGDVVLFKLPRDFEFVGICNGQDVICLSGDGSFVDFPIRKASFAWHLS